MADYAPVSPHCQQIFKDYMSGLTIVQVGKRHGITKQAVHQIVSKVFGRVERDNGTVIFKPLAKPQAGRSSLSDSWCLSDL